MKLEGKVAVVTGGGQGIGRAIALAFAREGADISIWDIDVKAAKAVTDEVEALQRKALAIACDVSNSKAVLHATKEVLNYFEKVDVLVNNAGVSDIVPAEETTEAILDRNIGINLKGQFLCSQIIGKHMIKQKHGKIIHIATTSAHMPSPFVSAYAASKGGVISLARALAVEWAPYNINVNVVSPGATDTDMNTRISQVLPGWTEDRVKRIPLQRMNKPDDVAGVVLFLASPESDNITGQIIVVDGGQCALTSGYPLAYLQRG